MRKDIGLDLFLSLMDGAVTEGIYPDPWRAGFSSSDTPEFFVSDKGVEPRVLQDTDPDYERTLGLLAPAERAALRQFNAECRLDFPCSLDAVKDWAANIIGIEPPEIEARYKALTGEPPRKRGPKAVIADEHLAKMRNFMDEDGMTQADAAREVAKLFFEVQDRYAPIVDTLGRKYRAWIKTQDRRT